MESDILRQHSLALSPWPSKTLLKPTDLQELMYFEKLYPWPLTAVATKFIIDIKKTNSFIPNRKLFSFNFIIY